MATIVIDFDGIICVDKYPKVGMIKRDAKKYINKLYENHTIIINTCRVNQYVDEAKSALYDAGIKYHYFNQNSDDLIRKYGADCRKISGEIYVDDKNLEYKFMNWKQIIHKVNEKLSEKPIIIAIVGESGTGKSLIANQLEQYHGIGMIESYTTRPPRFEGERGHTFISDEEYDQLCPEDMIAYTKFGDYRYCCLKQDVKAINSYIIDEKGLRYLENNFGDDYEILRWRVYRDSKLRNISNERKQRDDGKFTGYNDNYWNATIYNNGNIEELYWKISCKLNDYFTTYHGIVFY